MHLDNLNTPAPHAISHVPYSSPLASLASLASTYAQHSHEDIELLDRSSYLGGGGEVDYVTYLSIVTNSRLMRDGLVVMLMAHMDVRLVGSYPSAFPPNNSKKTMVIPVPKLVSRLAGPAHPSVHGNLPSLMPLPELPNPYGHIVLVDGSDGGMAGTGGTGGTGGPGGAGQEAAIAWIRHWRDLTPPAQVIVVELPCNNSMDLFSAYVEAGASACTVQGASVVEVSQAIRHMRQSESGSELLTSPVKRSPDLNSKNANNQNDSDHRTLDSVVSGKSAVPLTVRELEVLRCITEDYSNQQIANLLVIEINTVKRHVHNILEKLSLHSRWAAAHFAVEQRWFDPVTGTDLNASQDADQLAPETA